MSRSEEHTASYCLREQAHGTETLKLCSIQNEESFLYTLHTQLKKGIQLSSRAKLFLSFIDERDNLNSLY